MRRKTFILVVYVCMYEFLKLPSVSLFIVDGNTKQNLLNRASPLTTSSSFNLKSLTHRKERRRSIMKTNASYFAKFSFFISKRGPSFFWVHHLLAPTAPKHGVVLHQRERRKRFKTEIPNHAFLAAWESFNLPQHTYVLHRKTRYIIFTRPIKSFLINLR